MSKYVTQKISEIVRELLVLILNPAKFLRLLKTISEVGYGASGHKIVLIYIPTFLNCYHSTVILPK